MTRTGGTGSGLELGASIAAFDLSDTDRLMRFFANLPGLVDHVLVSGGGPPYVSLRISISARSVKAWSGLCCPFTLPDLRRTR